MAAIPRSTRLRVLTYNIRSGTDVLGRRRLAEQAAVVRDIGADVVLLQEVAGLDQAELVADRAGLKHAVFGATRQGRAGEFGNAVLSRFALSAVDNRLVCRSPLAGEPRGVLAATFWCEGRPVHAISTHFGFLPGEPALAARTVLDIAAGRHGPLIAAGDLNRSGSNAVCHRLLRGAFVDSARANGLRAEPTFPSNRPVLRLDYLYTRVLQVAAATVVPGTASDHRPLVAELLLG